jgi:hypothetical protein
MGHLIAAVFFMGLSLCLLLLMLKRARSVPQGQTFTGLHIPERCPMILSQFGILLMVGTGIGIFFEAYGGVLAFGKPFYQLSHETTYFSFFLVGLCAFMESRGRLPLDSHRGAMVVAFISSYLMWHSHGTMKLLMADQELHILLSYINLSNAAVVAYSMRFTDSAIAYVSSYALMFLQGAWILTAGFYECCYDFPMHAIATYLALQCSILALAVILAVGFCGPSASEQDDPSYRSSFSPLKTMADDGEEYGEHA